MSLFYKSKMDFFSRKSISTYRPCKSNKWSILYNTLNIKIIELYKPFKNHNNSTVACNSLSEKRLFDHWNVVRTFETDFVKVSNQFYRY